MRVFKVSELNHAFFGKTIFHRAELMVQDGEHIGLVGPNGAGKSTFFKLLLGEVIPDAWQSELRDGLKIGYLDQAADLQAACTVYDYLRSVYDALFALDAQVNKLYDAVATLPEDRQMEAIERAQTLSEQLNERGIDRIEKNIGTVLAGLGFSIAERDKTVSQLSGGMKTKLALARLLLEENDLLLLDEPTNFLDIGYTRWLGEYLRHLPCAFLVISHDRAFLNAVCDKIVEIANHALRVYVGNYDQYLEEKQKREAVQLQQHRAQQKFIANAEEYIANNSEEAMDGVVRTKATWLKKMLATMERIEKPETVVKPRFRFAFMEGPTRQIVTLDRVAVGYSGNAVLPPISLEVLRGDKLVFQGYNGIGKTTLLKSISGELPLLGGTMEFGERIESVFFKQEEDYENNFAQYNRQSRRQVGKKREKLAEITVIQFAKSYYPEMTQGELQKALRSCGLHEKHFFSRVRTLSGGEMTRLRLCLAMLHPVNLILLDEPTNHLDVYSKEVLMHALDEFPGTVLMTTHDVNADISWATRVVNLETLFDARI